MLKINLVPEIQEQKQKQSRLNYLTTVICLSVLGAVVIILVVISGIIVANKALISSAQKKINNLNSEISQYKALEDAVLSLESGLSGAKEILNGKNSWANLLPHLEAATPKDVVFKSLTLKDQKITANLVGQDINSLARFTESYKSYEIATLNGKANPGDKVFVSPEGGSPKEVVVKNDGSWSYSFSGNLDKDLSFVVTTNESDQKVTYSAETGKVSPEDGGYQISANKLFVNVSVSQYKKEGNGVIFDAVIDFKGDLIW